MADQLLTAAMEDRMTWKPISSAPRDGTDVLTYSAIGGYEISRYWRSAPGYWRGNWGDGEYEHFPTHWMPLEPPKETDDGR